MQHALHLGELARDRSGDALSIDHVAARGDALAQLNEVWTGVHLCLREKGALGFRSELQSP